MVVDRLLGLEPEDLAVLGLDDSLAPDALPEELRGVLGPFDNELVLPVSRALGPLILSGYEWHVGSLPKL